MNKEKAKQLIDDADIYAVITGKKRMIKFLLMEFGEATKKKI